MKYLECADELSVGYERKDSEYFGPWANGLNVENERREDPKNFGFWAAQENGVAFARFRK